ncbi:hypothetical protein KCV01_g4982, partial [Aureobasidium melanogenum]
MPSIHTKGPINAFFYDPGGPYRNGKNPGADSVSLQLEDSPCAHEEVTVFLVRGKGSLGIPALPLTLIEDTGSSKITIAAKGTYQCTYSVRHWFGQDAMDSAIKGAKQNEANLTWLFRPEKPGVYASSIFGGAMILTP